MPKGEKTEHKSNDKPADKAPEKAPEKRSAERAPAPKPVPVETKIKKRRIFASADGKGLFLDCDLAIYLNDGSRIDDDAECPHGMKEVSREEGQRLALKWLGV